MGHYRRIKPTIAQAVDGGDQLEALQAIADRLAKTLDADDQPAHVVAPISRELARALAEIADPESLVPEQTIAEALAEARLTTGQSMTTARVVRRR